jgi:uncharacterized protein YecT (DUF1311 family)
VQEVQSVSSRVRHTGICLLVAANLVWLAPPLPLRAQAPVHCVQGESNTLGKFLEALGPIGNGTQLLSLVVKDVSWKGRLGVVAATAGAISSVYNTYLKNSPVFYTCAAPAGSASGPVLLTADAYHGLQSPTGQIDPAAFSTLLRQDYARLNAGPAPPAVRRPQLPSDGAPPAWPPASPADTTTIRGFVDDGSGRRLSAAAVQIISAQNGDSWVSTLTNWDGEFQLIAPPGRYVIYAHTAGFGDYTITVTKEPATDRTVPIHLLREGRPPALISTRVAPSFDCGRASTVAEVAICSDNDLAAAERAMVNAYYAALDRLSGAPRDELRRDHARWFRDYARTCNALRGDALKACVLDHLSRHTRELQSWR